MENTVRMEVPPNPARKKIWIDLDNTPHVPFFQPIIRELERRGFVVLTTARDAFQVLPLASSKGMKAVKIGKHYGKRRLMKLWGLVYRAGQCAPHILRFRPDLAVSHGSRSQIFLSNLLGIPSVLLFDYEHVTHLPFARPSYMIGPELISADPKDAGKSIRMSYPGIKEDVYACSFQPDPEFGMALPLDKGKIIATVRPPATEAHYHRMESDLLFAELMNRLSRTAAVQVILLPRNRAQAADIATRHPEWFERGRTIIPDQALDGMNLIWHSDLVVSGGGTMNREAAALGVPVYSIFRGPTGAVDQHLAATGRLVMLASVEDLDNKLRIRHRDRSERPARQTAGTLEMIIGYIEQIYRHRRNLKNTTRDRFINERIKSAKTHPPAPLPNSDL